MNTIFSWLNFSIFFIKKLKCQYFLNNSYTNEKLYIFRHVNTRTFNWYTKLHLIFLQTWWNFDFKVDCPKKIFWQSPSSPIFFFILESSWYYSCLNFRLFMIFRNYCRRFQLIMMKNEKTRAHHIKLLNLTPYFGDVREQKITMFNLL